MPWVLDLDGVVWRGDRPIPGAVAGIGRLRDAGVRVGFCTNNASLAPERFAAALVDIGVPAVPEDVLGSANVAVDTLQPTGRVLACAGEGVTAALAERGIAFVRADDPSLDDPAEVAAIDTVLVGFHDWFDYAAMRRATRAVLGGASLVATNDDPLYPAPGGLSPGCGSILAAIERATGVRAPRMGKPHGPMADAIRRRFGDTGVFVGDTLGTDAAMAERLGWPFGLVLSGNTASPDLDRAVLAPGTEVAPDLAGLVDRALAEVLPHRPGHERGAVIPGGGTAVVES
ncbi:MAG: HAD-IIA family hydrolase [Microthrixaceae bacterium]